MKFSLIASCACIYLTRTFVCVFCDNWFREYTKHLMRCSGSLSYFLSCSPASNQSQSCLYWSGGGFHGAYWIFFLFFSTLLLYIYAYKKSSKIDEIKTIKIKENRRTHLDNSSLSLWAWMKKINISSGSQTITMNVSAMVTRDGTVVFIAQSQEFVICRWAWRLCWSSVA